MSDWRQKMREYDRLTPRERRASIAGVYIPWEWQQWSEAERAKWVEHCRAFDKAFLARVEERKQVTRKRLEESITIQSPFNGSTYELTHEQLETHCFFCARAGDDGFCSNHEHLRGTEEDPLPRKRPEGGTGTRGEAEESCQENSVDECVSRCDRCGGPMVMWTRIGDQKAMICARYQECYL